MRRRNLAVAVLVALAAASCRGGTKGHRPPPAGAVDATPAPDASGPSGWFPDDASIAAHVAELAGPALRGRGDGTADEVAAAARVATWLREAGAEPAGDDGFITRFTYPGGASQNVVGVIRGTEPTAGHVVVGAHYDHLGTDATGTYFGADDNASGTAGLVAIAGALARAGQRPRRTVVVVAFGAEEAGLHGSVAYVARPTLPLADAVAMINLDMIGRATFLSAKEYGLVHAFVPVDAIGALTSPGASALADVARAAAAPIGRPVVAASDFGPLEDQIRPLIEQRGDQASFAAAGVPYLWLSTSMHDDYHLPTDTADKVDPGTIAAVGRIVVGVIAAMPDRAALQPAAAPR
ncbi:MAG: M20/M25/M40 family metallo-hydrolase [Myxococcales bacterium]|nr:M20/M25/M40 family metallo-hydrolase [Myxococcales bacterium]